MITITDLREFERKLIDAVNTNITVDGTATNNITVNISITVGNDDKDKSSDDNSESEEGTEERLSQRWEKWVSENQNTVVHIGGATVHSDSYVHHLHVQAPRLAIFLDAVVSANDDMVADADTVIGTIKKDLMEGTLGKTYTLGIATLTLIDAYEEDDEDESDEDSPEDESEDSQENSADHDRVEHLRILCEIMRSMLKR